MTIASDRLSALDASGYGSVEAIAFGGQPPKNTHASPTTFVCDDHKTYWVKGRAQRGLVVELIAGRLGNLIGASPIAKVVVVPTEALPPDGSANHLAGIVVGIEDIKDSVSNRELSPLLQTGGFEPNTLNPESRALVIAFQTWLGIGDSQVLIRLTDGKVLSIDHGDCFGSVEPLTDPQPVVTTIPGVLDSVGKDSAFIRKAVGAIEAIDDIKLMEAVSRVPNGAAWESGAGRRLAIARWLAHRRDRLRGVMETWLLT